MLAATMMPMVMIASAALCLWCAARARSLLQLAAAGVMFVAMLDHALTGLVSPVLWAGLLVCVGLFVGASLRPVRVRVADGGAVDAGEGRAALGAPFSAHGILIALSYPAMAALLLVSAAPRTPTPAAPLAAEGLHHHHAGVPSLGWLVGVVAVLTVGLACTALAAARGGRRLAAADAGAMSLMLGAMLA